MQYNIVPEEAIVQRAADSLRERGMEVFIVQNRAEALEKIKALIPQGASVMNASSTTLDQIGFTDYLKAGEHGWNNLHVPILEGKDPQKQAMLRKQSILADFFLGSVHAIVETGQTVTASASGSQIPSHAYSSDHVIFVAGTHKIVPTLEDAMHRVREYVYPLENQRMKDVGLGGSVISKMLIFEREPAFTGRKLQMILVNEVLGF